MIQSPYDRLQSSFAGGGQSAYIEEMRKIGQARPSKPLLPDMCLEHIWTENTANRYGLSNTTMCEIVTQHNI